MMTPLSVRLEFNQRRWVKIIGLSLAVLLAREVLAQDAELQTLASEHRKWLEEEVVYIITDREREIFLILETTEERERFIESFWRRRDPEIATPENEFKGRT